MYILVENSTFFGTTFEVTVMFHFFYLYYIRKDYVCFENIEVEEEMTETPPEIVAMLETGQYIKQLQMGQLERLLQLFDWQVYRIFPKGFKIRVQGTTLHVVMGSLIRTFFYFSKKIKLDVSK